MSIKITDIKDEEKYFFSVEYIFPGYRTVDAFPKNNFETGFHVQAFYEINIITRGSGFHALDNQIVKANQGDVFIVPPHTRHAFVGGAGFDCYHFLLSPEYLQKHLLLLNSMPNFSAMFEIGPIMSMHNGNFTKLNLSGEQIKVILSVLDVINKADRTIFSGLVIAENAANLTIALLCEAYHGAKHVNDEDAFFAKSLQVIAERYKEKLTIEELCAIAGLSRTAYIQKFKLFTGMSPRQYILRERIKVAKNLLVNTDKSIAKIADEVGFFDTSHFSKCFTSATGMTPTEYREKNKTNF